MMMGIEAGLRAGGTAIVTGASSGIGRAIALSLGRQGLQVLLIGRNALRLDEARQQCRGHAETLACDLTTSAGLAALAARLPDRLDILVHAAGLYKIEPFSETDEPLFDCLFGINLRVPYRLTRQCLAALRAARGQVVFINSTVGLAAARQAAGYTAAKHALRALADSLRAEVNPEGIRVLSVYPGRTATPMQAAVYAAEGREYEPERLMQPDDVAAMVVAALSLPRSAEVTEIVMRPMRAG